MFEFAWPLVAAIAPLPLLLWLLLPRAERRSGLALQVPFYTDFSAAAGQRRAPARWQLALAVLGWLALVTAAARPQWIGEPISIPVTGRDLVLAVDISGSMETADMVLEGQAVNRLEVVKAVAGEFIQRRMGDRIGLILFGRRAYVQTPLTFDRETAGILLDESAIGLAGKETAIGDAIGLAVKRLRQDSGQERVLILLTDGANTAGAVEPIKAADLAAAEGLKIYTIGVGADEMMVRSLFGSRRINPSADLDEKTLTAIAEKTGGKYFRARDTQGLFAIYSMLDDLEPVAEEEEMVRPPKELFRWPLLLALLTSLSIAWANAIPRLRGLRA
jgi:Ca-activated chloride channel family protein